MLVAQQCHLTWTIIDTLPHGNDAVDMVAFITWFMLAACTTKQNFRSCALLAHSAHRLFVLLGQDPFEPETHVIVMRAMEHFLHPLQPGNEEGTPEMNVLSVAACDEVYLVVDSKL
jgi:hypothetical protein